MAIYVFCWSLENIFVATYENHNFNVGVKWVRIKLLGYFSLEVIIPQCQVQKMKSNELFSWKAIATRALL